MPLERLLQLQIDNPTARVETVGLLVLQDEMQRNQDPEALMKLLSSLERGLISALHLHHNPESTKAISARTKLTAPAWPAVPEITTVGESLPESAYNKLPIIGGRPEFIAAVKAATDSVTGNELVVTLDPENRLRFSDNASSEQVQRHGGTDIMVIDRAQDIMTGIGGLDPEKRVFSTKPSTDLSPVDIMRNFHNLCEKMAFAIEGQQYVMLHWDGADAVYERRLQKGVSIATHKEIKIKKPDEAFLYCYYFGTKDAPEAYKEVAQRMEAIAADGTTYCSAGSVIHKERMRGWTPEHGIPKRKDPTNPSQLCIYDVNHGFNGEHLFVEELLAVQVNGVHREDSQFHEQMQLAVDLLMGKAVALEEAIRTLFEFIRLSAHGVAVSTTPRDDHFSKVREELDTRFGNRFAQGSVVEGDWRILQTGEFPIDLQEYAAYIQILLVTEAGRKSGAMVQ